MVLRFSIIACVLAAALHGQWTGSGSSGSDGALNLTTPGTVVFEPQAFDPPLKPARGNIYNFTTIYIGKGVTVKLSALKLAGPVFWLAQGPVVLREASILTVMTAAGPCRLHLIAWISWRRRRQTRIQADIIRAQFFRFR